MIYMGIDPSINSTGICIFDDNKKDEYIYYLIVDKLTKKLSSFEHKYINIINYNKLTNKNVENYTDKELIKSKNIYNIILNISDIINKHNPDVIFMEGVSYGSKNSGMLVDLSGLNFSIRLCCLMNNKNINIISPSQVKKFAVGNGSVDKEVMVKAWKYCDRNISDIKDIKIDDLADSYFICRYNNKM